MLSDAFYEIEAGRKPSPEQKLDIDTLEESCRKIIEKSDRYKVFDSYVNEDIIQTLIEKERFNKALLNNWILVFDWNTGAFIAWDIVSKNPKEAVDKYVQYEKNFPALSNFEVVLVGSSEVSMLRKTHSHYFGIETYDSILESLDSSIVGFTRKMDIDVGARRILSDLRRRNFWGRKTITYDTIKNHFCKDVLTLTASMQTLVNKGLVVSDGDVYSLNLQMKAEIEKYTS